MSEGLDHFAKGVGKAIETVPNLYDDALKPTTQESGKVLSLIPRTINAALVPLRQWIAEREYNLAETEKLLAQKLEHVGEDKIVTPEAYVAVPAIQAISYTMNSEELRNLYANLLAKAMNSDTKDSVHPAYLETIKQLSPIDASYFKHISPLDSRPVLDIVLEHPKHLKQTAVENFNLFSDDYDKKQLPLIINNLSRLGLINIPIDTWYGDDILYESVLNEAKLIFTLERFKPFSPEAIGINYNKKRIDITSYGKNFYATCIS